MKAISKQRFDALCRSRRPTTAYVSREVEWFSDDEERVLGLVLLDTVDNDWLWRVLGRDEAGVFRCIDLGVSIPTQDEARNLLQSKLNEYAQTRLKTFPQGDVNSKPIDLFTPVVPPTALHPNFKILAEGEHHSSAREILRELVQTFVDIDGNFVKDFQTTGFNARLWELYLGAYLYEQRFGVAREFDRPDFCADKDGFPVGIEAVTVNPTEGEKHSFLRPIQSSLRRSRTVKLHEIPPNHLNEQPPTTGPEALELLLHSARRWFVIRRLC
jgi:hypothetical protein